MAVQTTEDGTFLMIRFYHERDMRKISIPKFITQISVGEVRSLITREYKLGVKQLDFDLLIRPSDMNMVQMQLNSYHGDEYNDDRTVIQLSSCDHLVVWRIPCEAHWNSRFCQSQRLLCAPHDPSRKSSRSIVTTVEELVPKVTQKIQYNSVQSTSELLSGTGSFPKDILLSDEQENYQRILDESYQFDKQLRASGLRSNTHESGGEKIVPMRGVPKTFIQPTTNTNLVNRVIVDDKGNQVERVPDKKQFEVYSSLYSFKKQEGQEYVDVNNIMDVDQ